LVGTLLIRLYVGRQIKNRSINSLSYHFVAAIHQTLGEVMHLYFLVHSDLMFNSNAFVRWKSRLKTDLRQCHNSYFTAATHWRFYRRPLSEL